MKPKLLDLFCCAGGAGMGYSHAGFEVVGIDIDKQPRYPFEFHQADALEYIVAHGHEFDIIHASPPCQGYSDLRHRTGKEYPLLIDATREALKRSGKPYIIENVEGAPLNPTVILCGTMFSGLRVIRHRLFETSFPVPQPPHTKRHPLVYTLDKRKNHYGKLDEMTAFVSVNGGGNCTVAAAKDAMGITWMTKNEMNEAIPPEYTKFIGAIARAHLTKHTPDKWESVPSTGIFPPSRLSTSQSESTPPTCG